ncbi:MAG: transketolase family protein [Planctomycetota bacterium]|nr:transketolase family protein [Planctomycetota bacterium]
MTVTQTSGEVATREAYGKTLAALGGERQDIIVLDADLSGSTKTANFKKLYPDRFFNMGVSECNMIGTASGLASTGLTVFASSFSMFAVGKAFEQVRQEIALPVANVKICGTHAGITVGEDGASHQTLEDIAIMRVLPNMRVFVPADARETEQVIRAVAASPGPAYVRLSRMKTPQFLPDDYNFEIGKINTLRDGADITIAATGTTVMHALAAADALASKGISARILNVCSIKPLDTETLVKAARETGAIVTVEEHQRAGGMGSAVAEVVAEHAACPVRRLGMNDRFGESGSGGQLMDHFGLTAPAISGAALELLGHAS